MEVEVTKILTAWQLEFREVLGQEGQLTFEVVQYRYYEAVVFKGVRGRIQLTKFNVGWARYN